MRQLKLCFIGCGDHANRYIYPSLANLADAHLAAVCALEADEAEANRKRHGADHAYTDYRSMVEAEQPDAVLVVGPPQLHYEAGLFCLDRKLPFFIEKPPGANLKQATELAQKAGETGTVAQVGFMMRHSAIFRKVNQLVDAEGLGRLLHGNVKYVTSGPYRSDEIYGLPGTDDLAYLWRYLMVQAVHPVNLAASLLGDVVSVGAHVQFVDEDILVEIQLVNPHAAHLVILLHTFISPDYGNLQFATELCFENRGVISTHAFDRFDYYPAKPPANYLTPDQGHAIRWRFPTFGNNNIKMGYESEVIGFLDAVREGKSNATDLEDGLRTMRILSDVFQQIRDKHSCASKS